MYQHIFIAKIKSEIMKTRLVAMATLSMGILFTACGGGGQNNAETETANTEEQPMEEAAVASTMTVDTDNSTVTWEGTMLGVYSHTGTVMLQDGSLNMEGDQITGGSFTVDLASMVPTDENYSEEHPAEDLIQHLASPDFFDVANFPTATFEVTGAEGNMVMGNLTIRGNTHTETIENVEIKDNMASGTLTFDRQKYGVAWSSGVEDQVLSDDIDLQIQLVAKG